MADARLRFFVPRSAMIGGHATNIIGPFLHWLIQGLKQQFPLFVLPFFVPAATMQVKLDAEVTFFEGGPDPSEMAAPAVSILTVIGLVPFSAAVARQVWVKYTLTSRRIKVRFAHVWPGGRGRGVGKEVVGDACGGNAMLRSFMKTSELPGGS